MELQELQNKIGNTVGWNNFGRLVTDGYADWDDLTEEQEDAIKDVRNKNDSKAFEILTDIKFQVITSVGECYDGATIQHVFTLDDVLYAVDYHYSSWDNTKIDAEEFYPVTAREKTITVYETV